VRGVAGGLGRLARNAGVLGVIGSACFTAAGATADAAPGSQVFALTISATIRADFDHTDCDAGSRAAGIRRATFQSSRPARVRFVGGRIQTVVVSGLTGAVKLSGTNTQPVVCGGTTASEPQPCTSTTRRFANGRVAFASAGAGSITIRTPRVALKRDSCPAEPNDFAVLPLGPAPGPLHISLATLTSSRTSRITLTASARRTKNYASPEAGFVRQRAAWKFTFVRIPG
jgi:hypothetical protein